MFQALPHKSDSESHWNVSCFFCSIHIFNNKNSRKFFLKKIFDFFTEFFFSFCFFSSFFQKCPSRLIWLRFHEWRQRKVLCREKTFFGLPKRVCQQKLIFLKFTLNTKLRTIFGIKRNSQTKFCLHKYGFQKKTKRASIREVFFLERRQFFWSFS